MTYTAPHNEETDVSSRSDAESIATETESQCGGTLGATFQGYSYDTGNGTG